MSHITPSPLLRSALRLDAVASAAVGLLTCLLARPLDEVIGAPPAWVLGIGLFMLAYGVIIGLLSARPRLARGAVWFIVIGNTLWALESVLLTFSGWITPGTLGVALLLTQAAVVALFAELQFIGMRRSPQQVDA